MPQAYSNPKRENEPYALPDVEYFRIPESDLPNWEPEIQEAGAGWYWWPCFPGCLPDGEPSGPFASEAECIADFTMEDDNNDD